jgi:hypothetical protein
VADTNGNGRTVRIPNLPTLAVLVALVVQLGGAIVWATNEHNARVEVTRRVEQSLADARERNKSQDEQINRIGEMLRGFNDKQNIINTQDNAQLNAINEHFKRADDRVDRVVQALDQTYNLLRETREQLSKMNPDGTKK